MKYTVPIVGDGSRASPFVPAYRDLLGGTLTRIAKTENTMTVEVHAGPPLFQPIEAPGHAELILKPDVVVEG